MSNENIINLVSVISVKDQAKAEAWYKKLLGREADITPFEGVAEWKIAENAWLQVTTDPEKAGTSTVIFGVADITKQRKTCDDIGVNLGDTVEIPDLIKMAEVEDSDANKVVFIQDISGH